MKLLICLESMVLNIMFHYVQHVWRYWSHFVMCDFAYYLLWFSASTSGFYNKSQSRLIIYSPTIHVACFSQTYNNVPAYLWFWASDQAPRDWVHFHFVISFFLPAFKVTFIEAFLKIYCPEKDYLSICLLSINSFPETFIFLDLNNLILFWFLFQ